jgi:hypothetical protein
VGGGSGGPVEPREECRDVTAGLNNVVEIFNSKLTSRKEFRNHIDTDLRQICGSPEPGIMECNFDWSEFPNGLQGECDTIGGQYLESSFVTECNKEGEELFMINNNVPGCVGIPCSPGESQFVLKEDHEWLADQYTEDGWMCTTAVLSVYAPNYDPAGGSSNAGTNQESVVDVDVDVESGHNEDDAGDFDDAGSGGTDTETDPINPDEGTPYVPVTASPSAVPIEGESSGPIRSAFAPLGGLRDGNILPGVLMVCSLIACWWS